MSLDDTKTDQIKPDKVKMGYFWKVRGAENKAPHLLLQVGIYHLNNVSDYDFYL